VDDITKIVRSHSLQFGVNYRQVDNLRQSDAQNFFTANTNVYWTNTQASQTPAAVWTPPPSVIPR